MTAQRSVNRKGWGNGGNPDDLPQWIGAGAFQKRTGDAMTFTSIDIVSGGDTDVFDTWPFPDAGSQHIYFTVMPPLNWVSEQIRFTPHFAVIIEAISLPGTIRFTLGSQELTNGLLLPTTKTTGNSDHVFAVTNVPGYYIGPTSANITITGGLSATPLILELTRDTAVANNESDNANFVGLFLEFI